MGSFMRRCGTPRSVFDAINSAANIATIEELNEQVGKVIATLGFEVFVGVNAVDAKGEPDVSILFGQTHAAWEAHYQKNRYFRHDAIIRQMMSSDVPHFWSDLPKRQPITKEEQKVLNEAGDFHLRNGFTTPIYNRDGSISAVLLMGENVDAKDPDIRTASHLLSVYYGMVGRRLHRTIEQQIEEARADIELSVRQIDCLRWAREGKSSSDIGGILKLSPRTVDFYLASACARLGVRGRVQAVAEAVRRRAI